ncbi:MAG: Metal-dependent phosphohydrolase, HD subdomain [Microgenomates bacterium 39_7]|nr:MAG: Metal-dependent phosphohydrolase, HD subdomain [Microgenomates bacterium 39_7]
MKKTLIEIYQQHGVPPNLAEHMLTVAALGKLISHHWTGPTVDEVVLIDTLLLHDIGNLIKFELNSNSSREMLQNSLLHLSQLEKTLEYWQEKQQQMIEAYGTSADQANLAIIKKLGFESKIVDLLSNHSFESLEEHLETPNWEKKLVFYCDLRVTPQGLASVEERVHDLRSRYRHRDHKWNNENTYQRWLASSLELEKQIEELTDFPLNQIQDSDLLPLIQELANYSLEVSDQSHH